MEYRSLSSGDQIPALGFGTWQIKGDDCVWAVKKALETGYRHLDTADAYNNHREVGQALKESGLDREEVFITSKVFRSSLKKEQVLSAGKRFLQELEIDYLDLLLIHWPNSRVPMEETLAGLNRLQEEGITRNIGVSNFTINHLKEAREKSSAPITCNQVEFHPYLYQKELLEYCKQHDIVLTAYSPLARGDVFSDPEITDLSRECECSPAQLVLRWLLDKEIVVIPKASSKAHIKDNFQTLNLDLPAEIKDTLDDKDEHQRLLDPPFGEFDK